MANTQSTATEHGSGKFYIRFETCGQHFHFFFKFYTFTSLLNSTFHFFKFYTFISFLNSTFHFFFKFYTFTSFLNSTLCCKQAEIIIETF